MKINDLVWHPMSIDILEFKIVAVTQYEDRVMYQARATHNIGACGRITVHLSEDKTGVLRFAGLDGEHEYSSGLGDFVEGIYYSVREEARLAYYEVQETLAWSKMDKQERLYKQAKEQYEKVLDIIKVAKEDIKIQKETK